MITNFKQFVNENLLVPRNLEGRKEKLRHMNIKLLSQEVIECEDLVFDESFMDIDAKFVKLKKVNGTIFLKGGLWTEIPEWLKDVEIIGDFYCADNKLTTLKNSPKKVEGVFYCSNNELISLEGCPENVGRFNCSHNLLTSLEYCPKTDNRGFDCSYNELINLKYCPKNIKGYFGCRNNKLTSLEGGPEKVEIFNCMHNKLKSLEGCPKHIEENFYCDFNTIKLKLPDYVKLKGEFIN